MNITHFFEAMPGNNVLLLPDDSCFTVLAVTPNYLQATGKTKEEMVGKSIFATFPGNPADPTNAGERDLRASFAEVKKYKKTHNLPIQRYDITLPNGTYTKRYWKACNHPIYAEDNTLSYIIYSASDITSQVDAEKREEEVREMKHLYNLFMQAPVAIAILRGRDLNIDLANDSIAELWGKGNDILNKPIEEVLPEIRTQGFIDLLLGVMDTGEAFYAYEAPVTLVRAGKEEVVYFNFIYKPWYENNEKKAAGVLIFATDVTERIKIKGELAQKEESLALAIDIGNLGIYNINLLNNTSTFSQRIKDWFGLDQQNNPLEDTLQHIHPDDRQLVADTIARSMEKDWNGRHDIVYRANTPKNAPVLYVRSTGQVQYKNGEAVALSGIAQDVTRQVLATKKIEESEAYFRSLADQAPLTIFMADVNGSVSYWNKHWLQFTGQSFEEALGLEGWAKIVHPDDYRFLLDTYLAAATAKQQYSVEVRMKRWDGHWRYLHFTGAPRFLPDGTFAGYVGTATDSTDSREARKALERSEQNMRNIFAQAPVGMSLFRGPEFIVEIVNSRTLYQWCRREEEVLNKPLFSVFYGARMKKYHELLQNVFATGKTYSAFGVPVPLIQNGMEEMIYVSFVLEALREANGEITGVMAVSDDVTEQVLAHQKIEEVVALRTKELDKAIQHLLQSNIELNQFAYIASHDLQEPLRKVKVFTGLMEKALGEIPANAKDYMVKIHNSTDRMQTLIDDVLRYSQLSKEGEKFEVNDLNALLENVLNDYELLIAQKQAQIMVDILPSIEAIPLQMSQLFTNLLSNALKFSSEKRKLQISISSRQLSTEELEQYKELNDGKVHWLLAFKDNGIGFSQEYAQKVFTIFYRLHGKQDYKGTGIGLSLCKKIVSNHHGLIHATSVQGEGATFTVILPAQQGV